MKKNLFVILCAAVCAFPCAAAIRVTSFDVCPGSSGNLYSKDLRNIFDAANDIRICVKIVNALTNEPSTATFWTHSNGSKKDHGTRKGGACFNLVKGPGSVHAGSVAGPTRFWVSSDIAEVNHQLTEDDVLARIIPAPIAKAPNGEPLNVCVPACKQTPKPPAEEAGTYAGSQCKWTCEASLGGIWHRTCGGVTFDRKGKATAF